MSVLSLSFKVSELEQSKADLGPSSGNWRLRPHEFEWEIIGP